MSAYRHARGVRGGRRRAAVLLATFTVTLAGTAEAMPLDPAATSAVSLDATVTANQPAWTDSVTSPALTTSGPDELLVAFVATDGPDAADAQAVTSVASVAGSALTWTLRQRENDEAGTAEIWTAVAPSPVAGERVRAAYGGSFESSITVAAFAGADTTSVGASGHASAGDGAPAVDLTTTRAGSWVWGVGDDWATATPRVVGDDQAEVAQYLSPSSDTFWVQRADAVTPQAGTKVTLDDSAPTSDRWNVAAIEILPAATAPPGDTTPPAAPTALTAVAGGPTTVGLQWTAATDDVGVTAYQVWRDGAQIGAVPTNAYTDNDVDPATKYTYTVRAVDAAGNVSAASAPATVTTPSTPDRTPPVITAVAAVSVTDSTAVITWVTSETATSLVQYGPDATYGLSSPADQSLLLAHSVTLTGLDAATTYHYRVRSADAAGNTGTSPDATFTTAPSSVPPPDTTPPDVGVTDPTGGSTVSGTIQVTATATDNVAVTAVAFDVDGTALGSASTTSPYTASWDTTQVGDGRHTITATARDAAGNTRSSSVDVVVDNSTQPTLTVDGNEKYQTMDGFGVNANSESWKNGELKPAIDQLVSGGSTLWRVITDNADWEATNDNADPNTFNWSYYDTVYSSPKFEDLWNTIAYLNSKGIDDTIELNFMGPGPAWMGGGTLRSAQIGEWVEMISSAVYYARTTMHLKFGLLSPTNEPDWDCNEGICMTPSVYAAAMTALATKLDAIGISDLRFVGPDTARAGDGAQGYVTAMASSPTLMAKLAHFSFHDYSGSTGNAQQLISSTRYPNTNFWMSEFSRVDDGLNMLDQGASALLVWEGYDSAYYHPLNRGQSYIPPNDAGNGPALLAYDTDTGTYTPRKEFYQFEQLFKFVPPGSVRIGADDNLPDKYVYAFHDPASGRTTIVGETGGSSISYDALLTNLPAVATMQMYTTNTGSTNFARGADIPVTGNRVAFTVPANTIFTLTSGG